MQKITRIRTHVHPRIRAYVYARTRSHVHVIFIANIILDIIFCDYQSIKGQGKTTAMWMAIGMQSWNKKEFYDKKMSRYENYNSTGDSLLEKEMRKRYSLLQNSRRMSRSQIFDLEHDRSADWENSDDEDSDSGPAAKGRGGGGGGGEEGGEEEKGAGEGEGEGGGGGGGGGALRKEGMSGKWDEDVMSIYQSTLQHRGSESDLESESESGEDDVGLNWTHCDKYYS